MRNKIEIEYINNIKKKFLGGMVLVFVLFTFVIISGNSSANLVIDDGLRIMI